MRVRSVATSATMTKEFQRQPFLSKTRATSAEGFSQNRRTGATGDRTPGIGGAGSIQPYSVSARSGAMPRRMTESGRAPTTPKAKSTCAVNASSSET